MCEWHIMLKAKLYKHYDGLMEQVTTYTEKMEISYKAQ
jgi:hypothetical protein